MRHTFKWTVQVLLHNVESRPVETGFANEDELLLRSSSVAVKAPMWSRPQMHGRVACQFDLH
jgi:hypothetical protein